jgi:DNA-binding NarL/FixJ family response regulator
MADVVHLIQDLMFTSKLREVARQSGVSLQGARDPAGLAAAARDAKLVIVDLRLPRALDALDALAADPAARGVRKVGFVDHEKTDVMEAARAHGCTDVMAKGQFAKELPRLLAQVAGPPPPAAA